ILALQTAAARASRPVTRGNEAPLARPAAPGPSRPRGPQSLRPPGDGARAGSVAIAAIARGSRRHRRITRNLTTLGGAIHQTLTRSPRLGAPLSRSPQLVLPQRGLSALPALSTTHRHRRGL